MSKISDDVACGLRRDLIEVDKLKAKFSCIYGNFIGGIRIPLAEIRKCQGTFQRRIIYESKKY